MVARLIGSEPSLVQILVVVAIIQRSYILSSDGG